MITLAILTIMLVILVVASIVVLGLGGGVFIVIFGDLIVCALVLVWLIKRLFKKR